MLTLVFVDHGKRWPLSSQWLTQGWFVDQKKEGRDRDLRTYTREPCPGLGRFPCDGGSVRASGSRHSVG